MSRRGDFGLEAEVAVLSMNAVGPFVTVLVLCTLDPDGPIAAAEFGEHLRERAEVINAFYVAGSPDVALEVITRTVEDYQRFLSDVSEAFPNLKNVQSLVVLEHLKRSFALPFTQSADARS